MKKLLNIKIAFLALTATALFSSCLKDKASRVYDFASNAPVVDFALTANQTGKVTASAPITVAAGINKINFLVTVQSANPTTAAVTVNTAIMDQTSLSTAAVGYTVLPASTYTITGGTAALVLTIPPGTTAPSVGSATVPIVGALPTTFAQGQGAIQFNVDAAAVKALQAANPTLKYALPLIITSASGQGVIVDQFNKLIYTIPTL